MKKVMNGVLGLMMMSGVVFAGQTATETEKALVQEVIPGTKIAKVEKGEIDGFYKAFMDNGRILYIYPFGKKIFFGEIYTSGGINLSENDRKAWEAEIEEKKSSQTLETFNYQEAHKTALPIDFNGGGSRYILMMITDPQCPFCKKAEEFISAKKASVEYLYSVMVPSHTQAPSMIQTILSSKAPKEVILKYLKNEAVESSTTNASKERYASMKEIAATLRVQGTPTFVVIDKTTKKAVKIISGAKIDEINNYVD